MKSYDAVYTNLTEDTNLHPQYPNITPHYRLIISKNKFYLSNIKLLMNSG